MKKSVLALVLVAASGASMGQSSVTLSGNINLGVVKNKGASAKLDAANGASQIVFSGTEDLGGGLKASVRLAQRLSPESGHNDGTFNERPTFQGESTVGLAGHFGAVKLGRQLTALQGPIAATDPWGTWTVGSTANLQAGYTTDPVANTDGAGAVRTDAITYASPSWGGFSAAASIGLKASQAKPGAAVQSRTLGSLWLSYAQGPLMIGGGYERNRQDDKLAAVLGVYDFGMVKLGAGYSWTDTVAVGGDKRKAWNLMATAPIGVVTLKAGYAHTQAEGSGIETRKLGVGGEYALSKRTFLYTTYARSRTLGAPSTHGFDMGINHAF